MLPNITTVFENDFIDKTFTTQLNGATTSGKQRPTSLFTIFFTILITLFKNMTIKVSSRYYRHTVVAWWLP